MDPEKTPADGVSAYRRRREAARGAPTFVDVGAPLRHPEVIEELRLCGRGSRLVARMRARHAVATPATASVRWWAPGEQAGSPLVRGDVSGLDATPDGRAIAFWTLEKGYFNVIEPTSLRSATVGWRSPKIGRWGVRF